VEAEDLIVDKGGKRKVIEEIGEVFPDICVTILSKALVIETINLSDLTGFVIATENCDSGGVSDFESNKERDSFYRVVTSIDIIS
jgi:hypothetical protein